MKKNILFITAALFVAFLSSCSDDTTTSPDPEQGTGFPLAAGNWWKYETYEVDVNGNPLGDLKTTYTTTLGSKITLDGREAYERTQTSVSGNSNLRRGFGKSGCCQIRH